MFTIPNLLSAIRLLGVPFFLALILSGDSDAWAIALLMFAGLTDYLDGKVARILKQESKLGSILDPSIDRLYIAASLYVLWNRDIFPLWLLALLIARDFILLLLNVALKSRKLPLLEVNFIGKAATFNLLYAFPLLFLAQAEGSIGTVAFIFGWAFSAWGVALYVITGFGYLVSGWKSIRFPNGLIAG